jgi:site-specific recombinase XerD
VLHDTQIIGLHHLAFLRSWLQGLDIAWAWDRYMAFAEPARDKRYIERRRRELIQQMVRLGHQVDLTLPPEHRITRWLKVLSKSPILTPATVLPTLDEFCTLQGIQADDHSEAELIALYQDHYGEALAGGLSDAGFPGNSAHLTALTQVGKVLAVAPQGSDPVTRWLHPRVAALVMRIGAVDLARLVDAVNVYGYHWYRQIAKGSGLKTGKLGERQALRITHWLVSIENTTGCAVRPSSLSKPQKQIEAQAQTLHELVIAPQFAIVPLEQLQVPLRLSGQWGAFRTNMPNTLGASNDLEAIQAWLTKYTERPHTLRAYTKEVERFYLWCLHEQGKPLSSIDALDCQAYRAFLQAIPLRWIASKLERSFNAAWRPFRGQLSPVSQKHALLIVQSLFDGLGTAGYLAANPMAMVMKGFNLPNSQINVDRSFTDIEWRFVETCLRSGKPCPANNRLTLLLELLVNLGLRRDELARATRAGLKEVAVDGDLNWTLTVIGKRRKQREVFVPPHVMELLNTHWAEMTQRDPSLLDRPLDNWPLVFATGTAPSRGSGLQSTDQSTDATPQGLGSEGIYKTLKRFFNQAANAIDRGDIDTFDPRKLDAEKFRRASTHWLRHTFGRQTAKTVPLQLVQQVLGHASIGTTTIYVTTERDHMVRAMRRRGDLSTEISVHSTKK